VVIIRFGRRGSHGLSDLSYREEGPVHDVTVAGFWIGEYIVTNAEFAELRRG
jgi:formylglycine-generating enzyme required for sulfatase activity